MCKIKKKCVERGGLSPSLFKQQKKEIIILFLVCICFTNSYSQYSMGLGFHDLWTTSRNISVSMGYKKINKEYIIGLKYHLNDPIKWHSSIYERNLNSSKTLQSVGFIGEYRRFFKRKKQAIVNPFVFYQLQVTHKTIKSEDWVLYLVDSTWRYEIITEGPYWFWENHIGIGTNIKLTKNLNLFLNAGGGLTLIGGTLDNDFLGIATWQFSRLFSGGITYQFKDERSLKKKIMK